MNEVKQALECLGAEAKNKGKRIVLDFDQLCGEVRANPSKILRNIFQQFYDMVKFYVGPGKDEYPNDPESIGFMEYDCSKIFIEEADIPFFADRLFANRFIRQAESLRQGSQQNRIHVFEGPQGCGKSTFLNNLLRSFEKYMDSEEGRGYEIVWNIKTKEGEKFEVPCPSHDYPILLIPRDCRANFLEKLIPESVPEFKEKLFHDKEYEWIFKGEVCTICESIFDALFDKFGSLDAVLSMVKARSSKFDRRSGEGISVFNPGDRPVKESEFGDRRIQKKLDDFFGANIVKYVYSLHARTNNGIYVLMDIKSHNEDRLLELHNIISEGVHKVVDVEEQSNSLFLALMNPEDQKKIEDTKTMASFQGRIQYNRIRYVMEVPTEVDIYRSTFGDQIDARFLPRVLENFARVVISSRMKSECGPLKEWIPDLGKYKKYCDEAGFLLRMEIYGGVIPTWLSEADKKKFTVQVRRKLIAEGENEGDKGITGRESIRLFGEFFNLCCRKSNLINMGDVTEYFKHKMGSVKRDESVPKNFIGSLVNLYDFVVLNQVKESLYFYNKEQISEDILHYLYAVNYDVGNKVTCAWTGKEIEITVVFFKLVSAYLTGTDVGDRDALVFAQDIQKKYATMIAQDRTRPIMETELYKTLFAAYTKNLKEKALQPFLKNENFQEAVKSFGAKAFETYDTRLKEHVAYMIKNLEKFGYNEQGAKEICLYVIDQKLAEKFS